MFESMQGLLRNNYGIPPRPLRNAGQLDQAETCDVRRRTKNSKIHGIWNLSDCFECNVVC